MNRSTFSPINFSTGCPKSMCPRPYSKCWRGEALQPMNQTTESCVVSVQNRSVQFDKTSSTKHVETLQRFSFKLVLPNTCNSQSCYWLFFFFTLTEKICGENGIKKKKKKGNVAIIFIPMPKYQNPQDIQLMKLRFSLGSETTTCIFCFCIQTPALNSISSRVLVPKLWP